MVQRFSVFRDLECIYVFGVLRRRYQCAGILFIPKRNKCSRAALHRYTNTTPGGFCQELFVEQAQSSDLHNLTLRHPWNRNLTPRSEKRRVSPMNTIPLTAYQIYLIAVASALTLGVLVMTTMTWSSWRAGRYTRSARRRARRRLLATGSSIPPMDRIPT